MKTIETDPKPSTLSKIPALGNILRVLMDQLSHCQNTLDEFIREKRTIFPRFFFLSDDDLLELLGQTRSNSENREIILQSHLKKIFPGATAVSLGPKGISITAFESHGDKLKFDNPVDIDTSVEIWLKNLEEEMRKSLHSSAKQCLTNDYKRNNLEYPTQVLCLVQNIHFTSMIEKAIMNKNLHSALEVLKNQLQKYVKEELNDNDNIHEAKLHALILQNIHHMEILNDLILNSVSSTNHWSWQKQLRFYVENQMEIFAHMGLAKLPYTYEYLGTQTGTLVRTQLTDKCFFILTQALHLGHAGNPFGPAGTGKTESVKALGGLLGRLVLIFNCDEGMDQTTVGRLLSGLALTGAWGCFDEFNRLEEKTMSGVAQQLEMLLGAIKSNDSFKTITINRQNISVKIGCGVYLTMNPAGEEYGGRRELPNSISRLLRPVAMWKPFPVQIAKALLTASGYTNSSVLAEKIVLCYEMASSILQPLHHYDWGLRALKTVINLCRTSLKQLSKEIKSIPDEKQQLDLVVQALKLNTLSKLSYQDTVSFHALLEHIFAGVSPTQEISSDFHNALLHSFELNKMSINKSQMRKCYELYEQLKQRMGIVIVGPPGSGKSTLRLLLKHALRKLNQSISETVICPKAMTRIDLLGNIDLDTRKWSDGIISTTALNVINQSKDIWSWIVCDGDIDPEWIESLNSVLDDNRLLTLPSGWRIKFENNVNFIFETHDLSHASPATITRMGIISLSNEDCSYKDVVSSWALDSNDASKLWKQNISPSLIESSEKTLDWINQNTSELNAAYYSIPLIHQVLSFVEERFDKSENEIIADSLSKAIKCIVKPNSINNAIEEISKWTGVSSHAMYSDDSNYSSMSIDWMPKDPGNSYYISDRLNFVKKQSYRWIEHRQHFFIFGPPASGKKIVIKQIVEKFQDYSVINIKCTQTTSHKHIIQALNQKSLNNKSGGMLLLIIQSLDRANNDKWGTSMLQSFLLQIIQYGGFWERSQGKGSDGTLKWTALKPFVLICTATIVNNTSSINQRLMNATRIIFLSPSEQTETMELCSQELVSISKDFKQKSEILSSQMIELFQKVSDTFSIDVYKWTTKDLIDWCKSIKKYTLDDFNDFKMAVFNESEQIFKDRLMNLSEIQKFTSIASDIFNIKPSASKLFVPRRTDQHVIMDFISEEDWATTIDRAFSHLRNTLSETVFDNLNFHNYKELHHLTRRIGRVIGGDKNVIVLTGRPGVGRRPAAYIAAEINKVQCYPIVSRKQFNTQIKPILVACGCEQKPTLMILEEGVTSDESVLGTIELLVNMKLDPEVGYQQLPFSANEFDSIISQLKVSDGESKSIETFVRNINNSLGIVMFYDSLDSNLASVLDSNSFLYQKCHFLWIQPWETETFENMATLITNKSELQNIETQEIMNQYLIDQIIAIFNSLTDNDLITSFHYNWFIKIYLNIFKERQSVTKERIATLQAGVKALLDAQEEVSKLKKDAAEQETVLAEKQKKANEALNQIAATMQSANVHKEELEVLKRNIEIENVKLQERKVEIEEELSEVEPIIQEARSAVGDIRPESLSEVRSLRAPPEPVRDILEGVLRLMNIGDTSWHSMKMFLSKRGIKEEIRTFDASNISPENLAAVEKLISVKEASFTEKNAKRASVACAPLAAWVQANIKYAKVLQKISPLEAEQSKLTKNLKEAEAQMTNLSHGLTTVDERVASLKQQLNMFTKEATEVEIHLSSVQATIEKAEQLVMKLSKEFNRWQINLRELTDESNTISERALLSSAFVMFLSNEKEEIREKIFLNWISKSKNLKSAFNIKDFLIPYEDILRWESDGLISDKTVLNNAIIVHQIMKIPTCQLVPLIIDPERRSLQWLLKRLHNSAYEIISQQDDKLSTAFNHAIRFGKILIIDEITEVKNEWITLLRGSSTSESTVNPAFRLILLSRDESLLYRIAPYNKPFLCIVNFSPQIQGLTDQLIDRAVKHEKPELQEQLFNLNKEKHSLQMQQIQLEVTLLKQLSSDNILHNASLLESLEKTQKSNDEITEALQTSENVSKAIRKEYDEYKKFASKAAVACLAINSLVRQYLLIGIGLDSITSIFINCLHEFKSSGYNHVVIEKKLMVTLLQRVLAGLKKENRHSVAIYLIHSIFQEHIPSNEWKLFTCIIENESIKENKHETMEIPQWFPKNRTPNLAVIQKYTPDLTPKLQLSSRSIWAKFITDGKWESIPNSVGLTAFQKLIIVWLLKPEKIYSSINFFIAEILGTSNIFPNSDLLSSVIKWNSANKPIIVIGLQGVDPIDRIKSLATQNIDISKQKQIWVNENNQSDNISSAIESTVSSNGWLIIVVPTGSWTNPELNKCLLSLNLEKSTAKIWLVTEDTSIPPLLASISTNIILEPPADLRDNLHETLKLSSLQNPKSVKHKDAKKTRLEFSFAICQAIIQERCLYIPQGWRQNYGFNWNDAETCLHSIRNTDRDIARGLSSYVYTGKITCSRDNEMMELLLKRYFDEIVLSNVWKPFGMDINLPSTSNLLDYSQVVLQLPFSFMPNHLNLPNNIQTAKDQITSTQILDQLKLYSTVDLTNNDKKSWKKKISPIFSLWKKLNSGSDSLIKMQMNDKLAHENNSFSSLAQKELELGIKIVNQIHSDLVSLHKMTLVSNSPIYAIGERLIADQTPVSWSLLWKGGPKNATSFLIGVCKRAAVAKSRISNSKSENFQCPDLSLFFFPSKILHCLLWESSKRLNASPENMQLSTKWNDIDTTSKDGKITFSNLLLEGAIWKHNKLQPCLADSPIQSIAPPISIEFVKAEFYAQKTKSLKIPLYTTNDRKELVFELEAPVSEEYDMSTWILNATALVIF